MAKTEKGHENAVFD